MTEDQPGCKFTLRESKGIFIGKDGGGGIAMLLDFTYPAYSSFLISGVPNLPRLEVPYYDPVMVYEGVVMDIQPRRSQGNRILVRCVFPDRSFFARRLKPEEITKYFPEQ